jgi:hypothetical protein
LGFAGAIAVSRETNVVGLPRDNDLGTGPRGLAYVFERPAAGWNGTVESRGRLRLSDQRPEDLLGASVAVSGQTIVVGAPGDGQAGIELGSLAVYERPPTGWSNDTTTIWQAFELRATLATFTHDGQRAVAENQAAL